jgi:plastocyanin
MNVDPVVEGATRTRYAYGPIDVRPGQNNIAFSRDAVPKPAGDGWIVRIAPNLRRGDGTVIPSDQVMLHHGVWLNTSRKDATSPVLPERIFAAGEEKTIYTAPKGYGYQYKGSDKWILNYMLHNLGFNAEKLYMTYDIDFIPADSPAASNLAPARPVWMDVQNGSTYPVFDAPLNAGTDGIYRYPDDAPAGDSGRAKSEWIVDRDGVLVFGSGHLHAGGTSVDLFLRRGEKEVPILNSEAEYFDPAGPISWDLAMKASPADWRIAVKKGDVLRISTTYNTALAAWYESMGIIVLAMADADTAPDKGVDPFSTSVATKGPVTHGELPENDNHGGEPSKMPDARQLADGEVPTVIPIAGNGYGFGDLGTGPSAIPVVKKGGTVTFDNSVDAPLENGLWHTVTSCDAPCNGTTGISYPIANGKFAFDSGQLGKAGPPTVDRFTWELPATLPPGTYNYFCRVHPSMRGAFRVVE